MDKPSILELEMTLNYNCKDPTSSRAVSTAPNSEVSKKIRKKKEKK